MMPKVQGIDLIYCDLPCNWCYRKENAIKRDQHQCKAGDEQVDGLRGGDLEKLNK